MRITAVAVAVVAMVVTAATAATIAQLFHDRAAIFTDAMGVDSKKNSVSDSGVRFRLSNDHSPLMLSISSLLKLHMFLTRSHRSLSTACARTAAACAASRHGRLGGVAPDRKRRHGRAAPKTGP